MRNGERVMKNMKYGILLGIALFGAMLFAACDNIFDKPELQTPIENGYGRVSIDLIGGDAEQESARTVLPSTAFFRYVYTFTKVGQTTGTEKTPNSQGNFILEAGSYTVQVQAYIVSNADTTLAASGTSSTFTVGSGSNTSVQVQLTGQTTGTQGSFKYTITYPAGATMEISLKKWPGLTNITLTPTDVLQGNGKTQTLNNLDVASYLLTVLISKDGLKAGKSEAVHIYPSIVTEYTKDFTDEDMLVAIPPTFNNTATTLTADTWTDDSFSSTGGDMWFKFTATATTQYIHAGFYTVDSSFYSYGLNVQLYDLGGNTVGSQARLYGGNRYISRAVAIGQTYYIRATPYNSSYLGAYRITFSASVNPPSNTWTTAIPLTAETWENGYISSTGEQWFKFTANANTQYIHAGFGTLSSNGLYVQLYDSTGSSTVGIQTRLSSDTKYTSQSVTSGQVYYIKVTPYSSSSATYRIAFSASNTTPLPMATTLTAGVWADGDISLYGEQWFKFTATSNTQYIHANFVVMTTYDGMNVQVYDSAAAATVGSQILLYYYQTDATLPVTNGQTYYIKVTPFNSFTGTYQIAFNELDTPPLPANSATATTLNAGLWADGTVSSGGEQWFKFTATSSTQNIHVTLGTLSDLYVWVYDSNGGTVGSQTTEFYSNTYTSRTVSTGTVYYIKVTPYSGYSGTYQITFSTSSTSPSPIITLTAGTWSSGTVSSTGEQWFKFTATSSSQYIHANFNGTLSSSYGINVQLYNSSFTTVGSQTRLSSGTTSTSLSVTSGQVYYIKVTPYSSSGTYRITFNTSTTPPSLPLYNSVTIDMYDSDNDGWNGGGALRINVNGVDTETSVRVSGSYDTYTFNVTTGDVVQLYWVTGSYQGENSFIVYYTNTPPSPAFTTSNNSSWSGSNALVYKLRGTMDGISGGTLLGSFTVP
ncbi:hypothetical protein [Treponema sp. R80B11-R83G3]